MVRGQTPKVAKQDKKKQPRGRAHKRIQYNRRFVTAGNFFNYLKFMCLLLHNCLTFELQVSGCVFWNVGIVDLI